MLPPGARTIPDPAAEAARLAAERKPPGINPEKIAAEMKEHPEITPDLIRAMLRGNFTVLEPGETLLIRPDANWTPNQVRYYQEFLDDWHHSGDLPFRVLVLPGEEFAVAKAAQ
jgi:hypothetical protein